VADTLIGNHFKISAEIGRA